MTSPILSLAALAARILPNPVKGTLYRFQPLARLIRRGLNRAAPEGLSQITVAGGRLEGIRLSLNLQSEKDYWLGTYEPELQEAVAELVRPGMVAYDVGANIGYITLLLARSVGEAGRVIAFEALPANLSRLRTNLGLNALISWIDVVPMAVTDTTSRVRFLVGPSGGMGKAEGSAGRELKYKESIDVLGISLDDFVYQQGNPPPEVVKMDIEGGEVLALPGMSEVLSTARPLILMELHGMDAAQVVWDALIPAGYQICRMVPGYPVVASPDALEWKAYIVAKPIGKRHIL